MEEKTERLENPEDQKVSSEIVFPSNIKSYTHKVLQT